MKRRIVSYSATQAEMKIASTTASPASFSPRTLRRKKAIPSGTAVSASPKLWIRSASSATEFVSKHQQLSHRGKTKNEQAERDRLDACAGTDDRAIDEAVCVPVLAVVVRVTTPMVVGDSDRRGFGSSCVLSCSGDAASARCGLLATHRRFDLAPS